MHNKAQKDDYFSEEYLSRCLSLTPEKRFELLEEMREFFWCSLPKETKTMFLELNEKRF